MANSWLIPTYHSGLSLRATFSHLSPTRLARIPKVGELIRVLEKYVDAYPKEKDNKTVKELYNLLDVMEMEW